MTFQPYDVLQISRDHGENWLDFSTLRNGVDFTTAQSLVDSGRWDGQPVLFRVIRATYPERTVLAATVPQTEQEADAILASVLVRRDRDYAAQRAHDSATLEAICDRTSLAHVLGLLAEMCHEKAAHVEEAWQDKRLAHDWRSAGRRVDALTTQQPVTRVSWHHAEG